jgi:tetratricopeptide (TPR) repeat protein
MQQLDGMRVVLSWGASPADLDGHLLYESSHVWFFSKNGPDSRLDVDHRDGYGPETITIDNRHAGQRYVYLVHDYSDSYSHGGNALERSQARVMVYVGQTLVRTYYPNPDRSGNLWTVFAINADGSFEDINQYSDLVNPSEMMEHSGSSAPVVVERSVSDGDRSQAMALNHRGEAAYQSHDYDLAIQLFQQAVALYPDFGQAYSNLGLTFDKAGNEAEAIWADRKALSLASGPGASRVRASTYYNIAKIYESKGEWLNALDNYVAAEGERHNDIYATAIARMKSKLQ